MRLQRKISRDKLCKYAIIRVDKLDTRSRELLADTNNESFGSIRLPERAIELVRSGDPEEGFFIKLKDINSEAALRAYADKARETDPEFAKDVEELADKARDFANKKIPD